VVSYVLCVSLLTSIHAYDHTVHLFLPPSTHTTTLQYCDFLLSKTIEKTKAAAAVATAEKNIGGSGTKGRSSSSAKSGGASTGGFSQDSMLYLVKCLDNYSMVRIFGYLFVPSALPPLRCCPQSHPLILLFLSPDVVALIC
jgi:hypothetical protein